MKEIFKTPNEVWPIETTFENRLPEDFVVFSATVTAKDVADGTDQTSNVLITNICSIIKNNTAIGFAVKGGVDKHKYKLTAIVLLSPDPNSITINPPTLEERYILNIDSEL